MPLFSVATKELARRLHDPKVVDWHALARRSRFAVGRENDLLESSIVDHEVGAHSLDTYVDANWAQEGDGRSTTGFWMQICGFRLAHVSQTQPGLPSLSTPEAELRAMSRATCEAMVALSTLKEIGMIAQATLHTDAAAAFQHALQFSGGRMRYLGLAQTFVNEQRGRS